MNNTLQVAKTARFATLFNSISAVRRTLHTNQTLLILLSALLAAPTAAQEIKPKNSLSGTHIDEFSSLTERVSIDVQAFNISGDSPLSSKESYAIVNRYLGNNKGINDIESAAEALENRLRENGESFYRVSFPPQELSDGIVDLLITRYKVGSITVSGNEHYSTENIIRSLPQLVPGNSPSSKAMARSLTVANQNSGKRTRLTLTTGDQPNEIDAALSVVDQDPKVFSTWLNNTGTEASGDYRVGANFIHRNMFGRDHTASLTFISSPEDFNEVQQFALAYKVPLYRLGGSLNLFAVQSEVDTGTVAEVFEVAGSGDVYGLGYSQILSKIGEYRHQLTFQLTDKLFDNDILFLETQIATDVRSRPASVAYQSSWNNRDGLDLRAALTFSQNLSGGSENTEAAYQASRPGAVQSWDKIDLEGHAQVVRKDWLYTAGFKLSSSSDRLITGEQFAVGGSNSVRGMEERELTGDRGLQVNLAAWGPTIAKTVRPILFLDYGRVRVNRPLETEFSSESVASTGLMLNWNPSEKISASVSYGYLLDGIDFQGDAFADASRDGDGKLHFNFSYRF